jgi:hypothetical protein
MAVAPRVVQCMPERLSLGAEDGFAAGCHDAGADEHAEFAAVGVAHAVGGLEVGRSLVELVGLGAGQVVAAGGA